MSRISFDIEPTDSRLVRLIVDRFASLLLRLDDEHMSADEKRDLTMDLIATHANGCPMDFHRLFAADDFNFAHDVGGIRRHIDRKTGTLGDCFVPRCAR